MSSAVVADSTLADSAGIAEPPTRLLVTVRERPTVGPRRPYRLVGFLECHATHYEFSYADAVRSEDGFLPLLGFPDLQRTYISEEMFPLFAERIMSPRRPDRVGYLEALDLGPDSEPWEILVRSGGRRAGDTIEVLPSPTFDAEGRTSCVFLVHGVRHRGPAASQAISRLEPGNLLQLRWDETNPVNPRAVLVLGDGDVELGYVPDPLVEYVQDVMRSNEYTLRVVRANGPEVGPHLRLLVRLDGRSQGGDRWFRSQFAKVRKAFRARSTSA